MPSTWTNSQLSSLAYHQLRQIEPLVKRIPSPAQRNAVRKIATTMIGMAYRNPEVRFVLRVTDRGAAFLTNQKVNDGILSHSFVDLDENNAFMACGPNGMCSGRGSAYEDVSKIIELFSRPDVKSNAASTTIIPS